MNSIAWSDFRDNPYRESRGRRRFAVRIVALEQNRVVGRMRAARSCYDHLAGRIGVALTDALLVPACCGCRAKRSR
jgi:hypothetical protein